ncbi:MAG: YidC/Oxa1 family membrane protein insertase, partial [Patescibacteria group bacterium]
MTNLFNAVFYQPILSVLIFIYNNLAFHDLGLAIIFLTILVRIVLFPLFYKGAKDQALIQRLQPHIKKIQLDHKVDKAKQAQELMALYKEHRFNPF